MNFNLSLNSFESSVQGVRNLIDLALSSPQGEPPHIVFASSQGILRRAYLDSIIPFAAFRIVPNFDPSTDIDPTNPIKEEFVDARIAVGTGYSESKWVAEQLLALATRKTSLPTVTVREGQIAGSDNGAWNTREWLPSLIKSSIYMGCIPVVPGVSALSSSIVQG